MLSEKGAIHSEIVNTIIGVISKSVEPLHENLNEALKELSSEDVFGDLLSTPDFSMAPILEVMNRFFVPHSNLRIGIIGSFSIFFAFISERYDQLCQKSQVALIISVTSYMKYCNDLYERKSFDGDEFESLKEVIFKTSNSYRNVFKQCLKYQQASNLNLFAERSTFVRTSDVSFMCREFLRMSGSNDVISDLHLNYMKLVRELARKSSDGSFSSSLITYIQLFARRFIKSPNHKDTIVGLGIAFEIISIAKNSIHDPEIAMSIKKLTTDLYNFLVDHSKITESLIENNLFHGSELDFFRTVKLETNLNLVDAFKLYCRKCIDNGHVGTLLADNQDSSILFETLIKVYYGDCSEIDASDLSLSNASELIQFQVFTKLVANNSAEAIIQSLLQLWSKSYFISDPRYQIKLMNLLKISLLSLNSTGLGETFKYHVNQSGPFTVSSLCFLSCFPFSLWQTLEKSAIITNLVSTLMPTWKYLNNNVSSFDLLSLVMRALSNIVREAIDLIKKEDLNEIISFLPVSFSILRSNTAMSAAMKHKLAVSMQKLLRGLLMLRDDRLFDVIDHITKLGHSESCLTIFDSWKSLALLPIAKHSRDSEKLNNKVQERIEMLSPKLFSFTSSMSPSSKILIQHYYRYALNFLFRYAHTKDLIMNPIFNCENGPLIEYAQCLDMPWERGFFDNTAEESIWKFICSNFLNDKQIDSLTALPVQISSDLKPSLSPSTTLNYLKDDILALQRIIEDMKSRRDFSALQNLHIGLQAFLKLK